jgi:hypothetical protein
VKIKNTLRPYAFTGHRGSNRRYFLHHDMPYPVDCALLGHRPTWVALRFSSGQEAGFYECSRCTLRPIMTDIARSWTGVNGDTSATPRQLLERAIDEGEVYWRPRRAESSFETSRNYVDHFGISLKVGNASSETTLDGHLIIPGWRGFYFGTNVLAHRLAHWRSRRPGRYPYTSPAWSLYVDGEHVRWSLGEDIGGGSERGGRHGSWTFRRATQR